MKRFEVLTAVTETTVLWDVTSYNQARIYLSSRRTYCLQLKVSRESHAVGTHPILSALIGLHNTENNEFKNYIVSLRRFGIAVKGQSSYSISIMPRMSKLTDDRRTVTEYYDPKFKLQTSPVLKQFLNFACYIL